VKGLYCSLVVLAVVASQGRRCEAFSYAFAYDNGVDVVVHPAGYRGTGGACAIAVGIDPACPYALDMIVPTQHVIDAWNALVPSPHNIHPGEANNIPAGKFDYESVLLHEMGHALGLGHPNVGAGSHFTTAREGANRVFDEDPGPDGVTGSADDIRGDDVNLNYFRIADNDPFAISETVDSTTYSRQLSDLPAGHSYSANAYRDVAELLLGADDVEAVLHQGIFAAEARRELGHDDVAGIRYAQAGLDELAGTSDDYTFTLSYAGLTDSADIVIDFHTGESELAATAMSGSWILFSGHMEVVNPRIRFNDEMEWFFNQDASGTYFVPGDADGDGDVDLDDLFAVRNNMGAEGGATRADGDFNGDGDVDLTDLFVVRNNFGAGAASVPEPTVAALLAAGPLCAMLRRRQTARARTAPCG